MREVFCFLAVRARARGGLFFTGKDFATEVDRIYTLGRLTPNSWIREATGNPLTVEPILENLRKALGR